jgi:hypothetical protein
MTARKIFGRGWIRGLASLAVLGFAAGAQAAPMTFVLQSGQIRVQSSTGGQVLGLSNLAALDGFSVTIDTAAGSLVSMLLTSSGPVDIDLSPTYAGYDFMSLSDLSLSGGPGTLNLLIAGPPDLYTFMVDPLTFAATLDASGPSVADIDGMAIASVTDGSGFVSLDTAASALVLQGVTIGQIGPFGDEANTLVLKADFVFVGEGVIPEPNGAHLMAVGVLVVALFGIGRRAFA